MNTQTEFAKIINDLETGKIYLEDLGDEQVARLKNLLNKDVK
jgi:hypothetical protein